MCGARLDRPEVLGYTDRMDQGSRKRPGAKDAAREDRLKAALKANLGRRKVQARKRDAAQDPPEGSLTHVAPAATQDSPDPGQEQDQTKGQSVGQTKGQTKGV